MGQAAHPNDLQALRNYTERFDYDALGNFLAWHHVANGGSWTRRYHYKEQSLLEPEKLSNRLTYTKIGNGVWETEHYSYLDAQNRDVQGCMTSINNLKMIWNFADQLQQADFDGGGTAHYVYDTTGQRIRRVIHRQNGTRHSERIYLGDYEIYREYNGNGEIISRERETLHVMDDKQRIALVETNTAPTTDQSLIRYQLGNHLGSTNIELNNDAALISYEEFHPFGTTAFQAAEGEVSRKRYRYSAKERDEETGLLYYGARYYAPWLGRWTTVDPSGLADGMNLYAYVNNNPVTFFDPTGQEADKGFFAGMWNRVRERATAPTDAQKAFKEGRYGDWAKHSAIDAAVSFNPIVSTTIGGIQLARAAADVPGQVKDAATLPRGDEAGAKMTDALITTTVVTLNVAGPKAKGLVRAPPKLPPVKPGKPPSAPAAAAKAAGAAEVESASAKAARQVLENEMRMARRSVAELEAKLRPVREIETSAQPELERLGGSAAIEDWIMEVGGDPRNTLGKPKAGIPARPARIILELDKIANDANKSAEVRGQARKYLEDLNVDEKKLQELKDVGNFSEHEAKLRQERGRLEGAKERLGF